MKKILFEIFTGNYHSYAVVHYFLLKYLKLDDYEIFVKKIPFLNGAGYAEGETEIFDGLGLREYNNEIVDVIYRAGFPYNCKPDPVSPNAKIIVFYTAEFGRFDSSQFNLSYDEIIKNENLFFLTPSRKSDCLFQHRSFVLEHGFDSMIFYPKPIVHKVFTFLNISAASKNKRLDLLLLAFHKLLKSGVKAKLILKINTSIYINNVELILKEIGLSEDILIREHLEVNTENYTFAQMSNLYNQCDCYISAGSNEACELPLLESSAYELPIIASDLSPQVRYLDPRLLVKTKGGAVIVDDLVSKMKAVIEDKNSFNIVKFKTWEIIAREFSVIVNSILNTD